MDSQTLVRASPQRPRPSFPGVRRAEEAGIATSVALSATHVATAFLLLAAGLALATEHSERIEAPLYMTVLIALTPAGFLVARRQMLAVGPGASARLSILNVSAVALLVTLGRLTEVVAGARPALWVLLAGSVVVLLGNCLARHHVRERASTSSERSRALVICTVAALVAASALALYPEGFFTPAKIWLSLAFMVPLAATLLARPSLHRLMRRAVDAGVLVLMALVVTNVDGYGDLFRYDYDFFLGPANAVQHGHPLLVDTFSQYGVGTLYTLSAILEVVPLTYGGLQAFLGAAYVLEFAVVYVLLRMICDSQLVAVSGLAVAAAVHLVITVDGFGFVPHVATPSTGPLRFGLPWVVVLSSVLIARSDRPRPWLQATMPATIAVAAIWSLDTLVYVAGTYAGVIAARVAFTPEPLRARVQPVREIALAVGLGIASVSCLSILTRVLAGAWPDWGTYAELLALYSLDGFGALPIPTWSPAYLVASIYVASALALYTLAVRPAALPSPPQLIGIAGVTALGATTFLYFVGRSAPTNLQHVAVPAVVVGCAWWSLLEYRFRSGPRWVVVAAAGAVSLLVASIASHNMRMIVTWLDSTPLVQVTRSPSRMGEQTAALFRPTPPAPLVAEASRMLDAHLEHGAAAVVLLRADRLTSVLLDSRRGNSLPIVNGNQDGLIDERALRLVARSAERLALGTIVLTEERFMNRSPRSFSGYDASVADERFGDYFVARALAEVRGRFDLHPVEQGRFGLRMFELRSQT